MPQIPKQLALDLTGDRTATSFRVDYNALRAFAIDEAFVASKQLAGDVDRFVAYGADPLVNFKVQATTAPSLKVEVTVGAARISDLPCAVKTLFTTIDFVKPVTNDRIDIVCASVDQTGPVIVVTGVEDASPVAPSPPTDAIVSAEVFLRPGMADIENSDNATDGFITDKRTGQWL